VQTSSSRAGRADLAAIFADDLAFRAWYDAALPRVHAYLFHRCGRDPWLAEELTQQTFVEALRAYGRFDARADPVTWLIGIARHRLVDHYRRGERERRRAAALADAGTPPPIEPMAMPDEVDAALAQLPALQRAVLVLHYMDGLSVREIARSISKSEAATTSLMARARDAFRRVYPEANDG
jgi:RNA polymerase sigma-70 factor (ECF subfamily)